MSVRGRPIEHPLGLVLLLALACTRPDRPAVDAVAAPAQPPASAQAPAATPAPVNLAAAPGGIHKTLINGARGVLIPGSMAGEGHFTPTEEEARRFEAGLVAFLDKARPPEDPQLHSKLGTFVRQYTGGTNNGHRVLFVLFSCRPGSGWGERFVVVKDGGSCYFDVEYDLTSGTYTHVSVHHEG